MPIAPPGGMRPRRGIVNVTSGGVIVPITGGTASGGGGGGGGPAVVDPGVFPYHLALVEIQFDTGWEYFSFEGVGTPSQYYEPYVLSIGSIERESPIWGGNFRTGDMDITFINYNQYFTKKKGGAAPGKYFYNRPIRVLYGASGLSAMTIIFTGRITKWRISESGTFTISARDISYDRFNTHIHETMRVTTPDIFPFMPTGQEPRLVPVVYGNCDIDPSIDLDTYDLGGPIPCYLIDEHTDGHKWRYVVAQHVCKDVPNVFNYGVSLNPPRITGHYFSLDETETGAASVDRISEDGTVVLSDMNTVLSTTGKVGNGALFTAANLEYLDFYDPPLSEPPATFLPSSSFTVHAWVYIGSKAATRTIAAQYGPTADTRSWQLNYDNPSDRFTFLINDAAGTQITVSANAFGSPTINTWYLVMGWWDATTNIIYISVNNGTANQTTTLSGIYRSPGITNEPIRVGLNNTTAANYWEGRIDEFGFWNAVLSPTQRDAIYNSGSGRDYGSLIPYMTVDPPATIEWTSTITPANDQFNDIVWASGLGLFVVVSGSVAAGATGRPVIISEDGIFWEAYQASVASDWRSVAWSEQLGLLVAVGAGPSAYVMTSSDGKTWTTRTAAANVDWNSVCWSPELSKFIAVASSGTAAQRVMESTDGISWTSRTAPNTNSWTGVCWSPELGLFVAVAFSGTNNRVMTSTTGVTWISRNSAGDNLWTDVCWSPELGLFAVVAASNNYVMTSPDGINWSLVNSASGNAWHAVIWAKGPGLFVATSRAGVGTNCMISEDGITWTTVTTPGNSGFIAVAWAPEIGTFVAVNYDDPESRAMFGINRSHEIVTATYDGIDMTCIDFSYDPRDESRDNELEITASVQGITSDGLSTGTLLTNPVDALEHFLLTYADCISGELNVQTFDVATVATAGYECAMPIIDKDIPRSDIINKWCASFLGSFYVNNIDQFALYVKTLTPPVSEGTAFNHDNDMLYGTFEVESNDNIATGLQYNWLFSAVRNFFAKHSQWDTGESTSLGVGSTIIDNQIELTYVRDRVTAAAVIASYAELYKEDVQFLSYSLSIDHIDAVDLNSISDITHWQGIGAAGYAGVITRVYQLVTEITPTNVSIHVKAVKLVSGPQDPRQSFVDYLEALGLTPNRVVLFDEGTGAPHELYTDEVLGLDGTPTWDTDATNGVAGFADATGDNYSLLHSSFLSTTDQTILLVRRKTDVTARASFAFAANVAVDSYRCAASIPWSDGTVYWDFGGITAGTNRLSWAGYTPTTNMEAWAFRSGPSGMSIWKDGVQVATQGAHATRNSDASGVFNINAAFLTAGDIQKFYFFASIPAEVPDIILSQFTVNNVIIDGV